MASRECYPECRCCGKIINIDNEEPIKIKNDGFIHIDCEDKYLQSKWEQIK